jgi:hypothetical protein
MRWWYFLAASGSVTIDDVATAGEGFRHPGELSGNFGWQLDPVRGQPHGFQRHPQSGEPVPWAWRPVHHATSGRLRRCPDGAQVGLGVNQPDLARVQIEEPPMLVVPEHGPGHLYAGMPEPQVGDPGPGVILMAGDPLRIGDLAELQLDGEDQSCRFVISGCTRWLGSQYQDPGGRR